MLALMPGKLPHCVAIALTSKPALTIPTPNMTIHLPDPETKEGYLNRPEVLVRLINDAQAVIKFQQTHVTNLKAELDQHLHLGTIQDKVTTKEGVTAVRCSRPGKWHYSEVCNEMAQEFKTELDAQMATEREEGIASQEPLTYYWTVRKNDKG
jgi:hypothetical protein